MTNVDKYEHQFFYRIKNEIYKVTGTENSSMKIITPYNEDELSSPYEFCYV